MSNLICTPVLCITFPELFLRRLSRKAYDPDLGNSLLKAETLAKLRCVLSSGTQLRMILFPLRMPWKLNSPAPQPIRKPL